MAFELFLNIEAAVHFLKAGIDHPGKGFRLLINFLIEVLGLLFDFSVYIRREHLGLPASFLSKYSAVSSAMVIGGYLMRLILSAGQKTVKLLPSPSGCSNELKGYIIAFSRSSRS